MTGILEGDEDAVLQRLAAVQRSLASIQRIDPSLARLQETFDAAFYGLEELARELVAYEEGIELDPERLAEVERRARPHLSPNEEIRPGDWRRARDRAARTSRAGSGSTPRRSISGS
jgi:hypothetical protein